jgi:hypothetical protein
MRPVIYIAGPITKGNKHIWEHVRDALIYADDLFDMGFAPIVPQLTVYWATATDRAAARRHADWIDMDFALVRSSDALFRVRGPSDGADQEVAFAMGDGTPVVHSLQEAKKLITLWEPDGGYFHSPIFRS